MTGPRVFECDEVNELIPQLEDVLGGLDSLRNRVRTLKLRINALEMIWGETVNESDNPDHGELVQHLEEMKAAQEEYERLAKEVAELGGHIKGLDPPTVDFYGVRDGHLIFWCWLAGDPSIRHWHHVDEGFAGRQEI